MKKEYERIRGWGDCDDFCTHAFGELLRQDKSLFTHKVEWTKDKDFWVRRASAVILIPAILHIALCETVIKVFERYITILDGNADFDSKVIKSKWENYIKENNIDFNKSGKSQIITKNIQVEMVAIVLLYSVILLENVYPT